MLRVAEIASRLGVPQKRVRAWIHTRRLTAFNLAGGVSRPRWYVEEKELESFLRLSMSATPTLTPAPGTPGSPGSPGSPDPGTSGGTSGGTFGAVSGVGFSVGVTSGGGSDRRHQPRRRRPDPEVLAHLDSLLEKRSLRRKTTTA